MRRSAKLTGTHAILATIKTYLPSNYQATRLEDDSILISGFDEAGWTLDGYVIPRLASGLYFAEETDVKGWEPGCYIDGHYGWRSIYYQIELARQSGFPVDENYKAVSEAFLEGETEILLPGPPDEPMSDVMQYMVEESDRAEEWLNDFEAPDGYSFGWYDGEFYLWDTASWEEVS